MERVPRPRPAYVDDMDDETGQTVDGTRRTAAVPKEKKKSSHRERERDAHRDGRSGNRRTSRLDQSFDAQEDMHIAQQQSQQQIQLIQKEEVRIQRRKSNAGSTKSPRKADRLPTAHESRPYPPLPHLNTSHQHSREDHTHYGMSTLPSAASPMASQQPIPIRPRPQSIQTLPNRPLSYIQQNGGPGYGPPPAPSAYYPMPAMAAPSYPPPSPSSSFQRFIQMPAGGGDYFSPHAISRPLASRFDPIARAQSAIGTHPPPPASAFDPVPRTTSAFGQHESQSRALVDYSYQDGGGYYDDGYRTTSDGTALRRQEPRESIRVPSQAFSRQELDLYNGMPPPARPSTTRRRATEYRAPSEYTIDPVDTRQDRRRSRDYFDEPVRPRRPSAQRHSVSYEHGPQRVTVEAANSSRRRQSSYEKPASSVAGASSTYEDKINKATSYQEDVGGPTIPLTADMLKKQQRRQAGSRSSTKSSASRDESDYKKSATTRTTRSGSGNDDENVTIKVTGQARVMVGNTAIDCTEGGQIEISQNKNFRDDRTQRSNSDYGGPPRFEDRRSRAERPAVGRTRMSSQSGQSYTRPNPQSQYAMEHEHFI